MCLCVSLLVCVCVCVCVCIYTSVQFPTHLLGGDVLDVGALGVIGGRGGRRVPAALLGVVEAVVVLVGAGLRVGGGVWGAAGEDAAAQQGEDAAHPPGVEGEAEGHEAALAVSADGEPDRGHQTAQCWGGNPEKSSIGMHNGYFEENNNNNNNPRLIQSAIQLGMN